jgi:alpha-1,2-mannosyltransferase
MVVDPPEPFRFVNVDFFTYYAGGVLFAQDQNIYDARLTEELLKDRGLIYLENSNYIYPPYTAAFLAVPAKVLPPRLMGLLWYFASLISLGVALWLIIRLTAQSQNQRELFSKWRDWFILALLFVDTNYSFYVGQINAIVLFMLVAFLYYLQQKRPALAGVLLGIAILIKVAPIIFLLYLLVRREIKALVVTVVTMVGIALLTLPLLIGQIVNYVQVALPDSTRLNAHTANQSISAFFTRLFYPNEYTFAVLDSSTLVRILTIAVGLLLLGQALYAAYVSGQRSNKANTLSFSLLLITMVLTAPLAWENLYVFVVIPILLLLSSWQQLSNSTRIALIVGLVLITTQRFWAPYGLTPGDYPSLRGLTLLMSLALYGALLLFWACLSSVRRISADLYFDPQTPQ